MACYNRTVIRRAVALGVIACGLSSGRAAGATSRPPKEDPPIDSASALAGLESVIADHPSSGYPAVVIDVCPMGSQAELATQVNAVVPINPQVFDGRSHAWVNPDSVQPGVGCWIAKDSLDLPGIFWVDFYARTWNGGSFEGITWGDRWIRVDESEEPYLNGTMHIGCLVLEDPADTDRVCMALWFDSTVGLQFEVTLETNDGTVTASDAAAAMRAVLPDLATALATNA
jgi:hypothetical protein